MASCHIAILAYIPIHDIKLGICHMATFRAKIGASGRLVIPAPQRRELDLNAGDEVLIRVEGNELRISSVKHQIESVQALVRKYNRKCERLSKSLIRDRRAEAAKE
jgi:AbrB family looped-hinge helix DNA binding protein